MGYTGARQTTMIDLLTDDDSKTLDSSAFTSGKHDRQPVELFPMIDAPLIELCSSLEKMNAASALDQTIEDVGKSKVFLLDQKEAF